MKCRNRKLLELKRLLVHIRRYKCSNCIVQSLDKVILHLSSDLLSAALKTCGSAMKCLHFEVPQCRLEHFSTVLLEVDHPGSSRLMGAEVTSKGDLEGSLSVSL
eukprot:s1803_g5.t1